MLSNISCTEIDALVKESVKEKRYLHCVSVASTVNRLNEHYHAGFDPSLCTMTGLFHDIARNWSEEKLKKFIKKNHVPVEEVERENIKLLHSPVGAVLSKQMGFPLEAQKAIRFHTLGSKDMGLLGALVYAADYLEPRRKFLTDEQRASYFENETIEGVCLQILDAQLEHFKSKNMVEAPITESFHHYLKEGGKL